MEVYGLRAAKKIAKAQLAEVRGDRGQWPDGYRKAVKDLVAKIDAEIDRHKPVTNPPKGIDD